MLYVYIIQSQKDGSRYIGFSADLKQRLKEHNEGKTSSNKTKRPFTLLWYCAFHNKQQALEFEKYLKSSSGYAFTKKRLI